MSIETRKFDAEVGKVLQLMIHSLYTNKDIFLRELISNSSDACDKLRYAAIENQNLQQDDEKLSIKININKAKQELVIKDNGIGMNKEEIIQNLGTIANSGTQRFISQLKDNDPKSSMQLIGQFGVGFYSAFMVADEVTVITCKAGEEISYIWQSKGDGEYSISEHTETLSHGTEIRLAIKESEIEYLEKYKLSNIIKTYSDHISFPIELINEDEKVEVINSAAAIWMRPKSEIEDKQYNEFYHHISHSPDTPWYTLHYKTEGTLEYTCLLFIPSQKPFDLFHPDRKGRVKLYVKKVFITEDEPNLIPSYFRFLRGVIDSQDLPLNISRETFQHNQIITKIRKSIISKLLSTLKIRADKDKEEYKKFWNNFGEVMKEGLCEGAFEDKERLLEVCRFITTKSTDSIISLDEYIDGMIDGQDQIYFLTGDKLESLRNSPQLEGFIKRDIEVILLTDQVDDFWVNVINQYKNKQLCSISQSDIDLDKIKSIKDDKPIDDTKDNEDILINYIKGILGDKVKDVKISKKLVGSPACLSIPEGAMNIRMEKYLIEQKQLNKRTSKVLEINSEHQIFMSIKSNLKEQINPEINKNLVEIIFGQACLIAGEEISDVNQFVTKINNMLAKA